MEKRNPLIKLITFTFILLLVPIAIVLILDPFYHYHKALPFLKNVLTERDYQVTGTIDHFDYDSVILGSSIAENINTNEVNDLFACNSIKAVKASGSNSDILYYLDRAYNHTSISNVIYAITLDEFLSDPIVTFDQTDYYYLMDRNPFNDLEYLLNKDVLFKKIPIQLAYSFVQEYDEGEAYSWYSTKEFSEAAITSRYYPPAEFAELSNADANTQGNNLHANIGLLCSIIENHPETTFYLYTSPCSALWWDNALRQGNLPLYCQYIGEICDSLCSYRNVKMYNYIFDDNLTFDLSIYMDTVHFSEKINSLIINNIKAEKESYNPDSFPAIRDNFIDLVNDFSHSSILNYYPDAVVN